MNKEYTIYADGIYSGNFREQRNAIETGRRFVKFPGIKKVTVCHRGKVVGTIVKGGI